VSHEYSAEVVWQRRAEETFTDQRYSRRHEVRFDGGAVLPASSAVSSVPLPWSDPSAVDPEEMLVASISSCHMLWFLSLAAKARFVVERYRDQAVGVMTNNDQGRLWLSEVTLRPEVTFAGERRPTHDELETLHHHAHEECFIANSVRTRVSVQLPAAPCA
jgi:organic hydroperoxide reductase OsmC/OhrA